MHRQCVHAMCPVAFAVASNMHCVNDVIDLLRCMSDFMPDVQLHTLS
jgi:hypothetical protein